MGPCALGVGWGFLWLGGGGFPGPRGWGVRFPGAGAGAGYKAQALEKVAVAVAAPGVAPGSSAQRFMQRRRAFMKKLLTVLSSRPSCCEMVACISLDGRLFSLKMAISVRRCRSVNTSRCFLGCRALSFCWSCSLRLQAVRGDRAERGHAGVSRDQGARALGSGDRAEAGGRGHGRQDDEMGHPGKEGPGKYRVPSQGTQREGGRGAEDAEGAHWKGAEEGGRSEGEVGRERSRGW